MSSSISDIIHIAIHGKRRPVKKYVYVKPVYSRDKFGRFTGGIKRKGYTRRILDYTKWTTGMEVLANNIVANNALMARFNRSFRGKK